MANLGITRGKKMVLKTRIVNATKLNKKDKEKYYEELKKYDMVTLKKILKFRRFVKA